MSSVQDKLEELRFSVNREKKQKQTAESKLEDIKKELERIDKEVKQKEERLDEKIKDATETCPDRVDTNRSPADIQKALQSNYIFFFLTFNILIASKFNLDFFFCFKNAIRKLSNRRNSMEAKKRP